MNPFKKLKAPCAKCPYKLGQVRTPVNPCPVCKMNGYQSYKTFTEARPGIYGSPTDKK